MTADDARAVEAACARLVALYANLNDAARWEEVVSLFAPDGRLARPSAPDAWIEGRASILAAFLARPPRTTRHFCSNIVIDVTGSRGAIGESAMLLFDGGPVPLIGTFSDRFALTDEGWRFAERRGKLIF